MVVTPRLSAPAGSTLALRRRGQAQIGAHCPVTRGGPYRSGGPSACVHQAGLVPTSPAKAPRTGASWSDPRSGSRGAGLRGVHSSAGGFLF